MLKVLSYIGIIFLTFIFTYIFDNKVNYTLLYMIILAPILDYIIFISMTKGLTISLDVDDDYIEKNRMIKCNVNFTNTGFLPIFFLEYNLFLDSKFMCDDNTKEYVMVKSRKNLQREFNIKAIHRGEGKISIENIKVNSLLGLFNNELTFRETDKSFTIYPTTIEVSNVDKLDDFSLNDDDDDSSFSNILIGEPGYEYKEYSPGDPLNRVNWKLSSKSEKIQVRKSSQTLKRKKVLILDPLIVNEIKFEDIGDLFIEALISMAKELYCLEYDVDIVIYDSNQYIQIPYDSNDVYGILQNKFSKYEFSKRMLKRFNNLNIIEDDNCDYIIFTSNRDNEVRELCAFYENEGNTVLIIKETKQKLFENEIYLTSSYSLEVM